MRLECNILRIREVQFAAETGVSNQVLYINRQELENLLKEDKRLGGVDIDLVNPGDSCRIIRVADVIEPRCKIGDNGKDFPGALGDQVVAGQGITCVLKGAAVVLCEYIDPRQLVNHLRARIMIDMWGPTAEVSPYAKTHNIVILPYPAEGTRLQEYQLALKIAGLKTAAYLAKAGADLEPDELEVYDLPTTTEAVTNFPDLPKIVYIFQVLSNQFEPLEGDAVLYGDNIGKAVPTILHPNEVLDGALLAPYGSIFIETYSIQNHPIVKELYRNHGKNLCFTGVIITNVPNNVREYERMSNIAANLAKHVIGADGAILTKAGGGAPEVVMARTAQRCEQMGIKTTLALVNMGIDTDITATSSKPNVIFNMPEIDAMVSMGVATKAFKLPPVGRVVGVASPVPEGLHINGETIAPPFEIRGFLSQLGDSRFRAVRY